MTWVIIGVLVFMELKKRRYVDPASQIDITEYVIAVFAGCRAYDIPVVSAPGGVEVFKGTSTSLCILPVAILNWVTGSLAVGKNWWCGKL